MQLDVNKPLAAGVLGQGAYGVVCAGNRRDTDEEVAVKKVLRPSQ